MRRAAIFVLARTAAALSMSTPQWDAVNGVWKGDRAAASDSFQPPKPLWIFGYGSLCWKADFVHAETRVGFVRGWRRFFAQRSADHRGTPAAPGLVATAGRGVVVYR